MINIVLCLLLVIIVFPSCIEDYKIPKAETIAYESEMVIQGRIQIGDESLVYISETQPLGSEEKPNSLLNAHIYITGEDGFQSTFAQYDEERACYVIDTRTLSPNMLYSLTVELNGEVYQTDYMSVVITPEIEEVSYKEREDGISVHVTTYNDKDASKYYLWTYEEDWEFHAEMDLARMSGGIPVYSEKFYKIPGKNTLNEYFYCWKHTESSNIHIYTTDVLDENSAKDVELLRIPIDDIRISYIYSILVKQFSLGENAYQYYQLLEQQTEDTGGLFSPMPAEIRGNVKCTSNPKKTVRGYVFASTMSFKRIFVYEENLTSLSSTYENCYYEPTPDPLYNGWDAEWRNRISKYGYIAFTKLGVIEPGATLYSRDCVDCTATKGATKKRPDFWPNNHE